MAEKFSIEDLIADQVESIDEAIAQIDKRLAPYEKLAQKRLQLLSAKRALLGTGPRMTGGTTTRVTLDDILRLIKEKGGLLPSQVAQEMGVTQATISSHLYRNKDRFVKAHDGRYYARDPKAGINTADDIEETEDDE